MDTLSLKKYYRQGALVDREINLLKQLSKSKRRQAGNTTLTHKGLVKSERDFLEFFVNGNPLSELLDKFYEEKGTILDNWIGVLGSSINKKAEILKVKHLLGKAISDKEIRQVYPLEWSDDEFQWYLEKEREELSDPEVIIYCCAECGDYDCGGIKAKIDKSDISFLWTFSQEDKHLRFEFDKYQYFDLFDTHLRQLEKKD
jgi:hypothetical protein